MQFHLPEDAEAARNKIQETFEKGNVVFEAPLRLKDGRAKSFLFNSMAFKINERDFILGTALDMTEQAESNAQVKSALVEKEVLLKEIHHRVKNNLAIISSLLNMQANSVEDKRIKHLLGISEGRIKAMAMIHELLYQQEDLSRIDFGAYIKRLLNHITSNYHIPGKYIQTNIHTDPFYPEISIAVPCALMINELITNAYKHAFNERDDGVIQITLKHLKEVCILVISDNGVGLPQEQKSDTLGFSLIYGLANQIGGTIAIERDQGTTFRITFPKPVIEGLSHQTAMQRKY